ncbi:MAG: periplasmic solute binding protein [Anaerocolumna sp.]|jgi:zinc transport system substrate-binding protein|nr:periplasmic solute binding protein [Anaerocolumna sp.]
MKNKLLILLGLMAVIVFGSILVTNGVNKESEKENEITIVTSFYPMYVLVSNVVGDNNNVKVVNLTEYQSGCLHDYQLTTKDMKRLENADIFVMNGGGMESFMSDVLKAYPDIPIINASENIELLTSAGHSHEYDELENEDGETSDEHEGEEFNAHVWLNMNYYLQQIDNVNKRLSELDSENASNYNENSENYKKKVTELKDEMETALKAVNNTNVIIFHDSFAYLAQELGLNVVHTVDMDSESALSAGEIAEVVDDVKENNIQILFTEKQYSTSIADNIAKETGAKVFVIDSIVTGDMSKDAYILGMKKNLEVLKEAFIQ